MQVESFEPKMTGSATTRHIVRTIGLLLTVGFALFLPALGLGREVSLHNQRLSVIVHDEDGSYELGAEAASHRTLQAVVGARVDHAWVTSSEYPKHFILQSRFEDALGLGQRVIVRSTGLPNRPDLIYLLRLYDSLSFAIIDVELENRTAKILTVQSIRSLQAIGEPLLDLGAPESSDRVLSEMFSTDTTTQKIYDLGTAARGLHRAISSQLIYNRQSHESLFAGALTADRFATVLRLQTAASAQQSRITSLNVDSTGTTEILLTADTSNLRRMPPQDQIKLSLPLAPGKKMAAETLLLAAGVGYHDQLESYAAAIRRLHQPPKVSRCLMGWESEKVYDQDITAGYLLSNAQWLAQHLRSTGFQCFHIEPGYAYASGEFATPNASTFPQGVRTVTQQIARLGLEVGGFVVPFQVSPRSWVYEHHKDWLVHNAKGEPIRLVNRQGGDFVLDITHPAAQEYFRQTYRTLVQEWGWRAIDVDGMDLSAIEGYRYRPNTTALEAIRLGLKIIRETAGYDVLLIADGSPFLAAVGLVDMGHISQDTAHTFAATKEAATGIAAHYYTHGNFWTNDPDCFNVQSPPVPIDAVEGELPSRLTLQEAEASIVLAALSGGKYEMGDDLPTLGSEPDRLALVTNKNLLQMARLGRAAKPLDLLTYRTEDEQPSIFFLREDDRQSMLAVFNWTDQPLSHAMRVSELPLPLGHSYRLYDPLHHDQAIPLDGETVAFNSQAPHSVRLVKIIDERQPAAAPILNAETPTKARVREDLNFFAEAAGEGVPALSFHWDFGDGVTADGATQTHTYLHPGSYTVKLRADGVDGIPAERTFLVSVDGLLEIGAPRRSPETNGSTNRN